MNIFGCHMRIYYLGLRGVNDLDVDVETPVPLRGPEKA